MASTFNYFVSDSIPFFLGVDAPYVPKQDFAMSVAIHDKITLRETEFGSLGAKRGTGIEAQHT